MLQPDPNAEHPYSQPPLPPQLPPTRPSTLTIICALTFVGALVLICLPAATMVLSGFRLRAVASILLGAGYVTSSIALWQMKKWGAYLYALLGVLHQIVALATHTFNIFALLIVAIFVAYVLQFSKQMS